MAALLLALGPRAFALPTDPTVVAGQAVVRGAGGNSLVIDQASGKAAIDWRSFNIGAGEAVRFNQPSAAAMTVNRVTANNPSEILGLISAPGTVFLINPTGIIFGRTAVVDVGSLVASTLSASTADLLSGRAVFNAAPGGSGAVRNAGTIISAQGGSVSLIGTQVSNSGSIATPGGTTGLIAGERVSVDFEGDGLVRYQVDVGAARALVEQSGQISADGGRVALQAGARDALVDTVLNVDGVVRARGISQRGGEIYLDGGAHGSVMVSGMLDASGTAPGTAGGQLRVLGENVGLIAIIGLSSKNAILIIEFARELKQQGMSTLDAALEACRLRFRPILMTSIAFIVGVLPLAISSGAGANSRHAIGTGVMGGMIAATVLAVFLVPLFYLVVQRLFPGKPHRPADPHAPAAEETPHA